MATNIQKIVEIVLKVVDETKGTINKASKNLSAIDKTTKQIDAASKKSTASVTKLGTAIGRAGNQAVASATAFTKGAAATRKFEQTKAARVLTGVRKSLANVTRELRLYTGKTAKAVTQSKLFSRTIERIKTSTIGLKFNIQGMVTAVGGIVATLGSLIFPIKKAAKFQRAMAEVQAIAGATDEQLAKLSEEATYLGRTTEFTGIQAAQAMKMLAMAGLTAEQALAAVGHTLQVAHAGSLDLAMAADIVTNIMTGFRLEAEDLARVNDVLVQTFTHTNSTLQELGYAMAYVAPVAAGLGADLEGLTATVGVLHNAGLKGTMAGTSLRGMLYRLFNPTKEEADLMETLNDRIGGMGLQLRSASGDFVGFVSLVEQLETANLDAAEAMALFGQRAGPGMAALLGMGSAALAKYVDLNKKAEGRAAEISRVMGTNVVGAFREAKSALDGFAKMLGNKLLPDTGAFLRALTELVTAVADWTKQNDKATEVMVKLAAAIMLVVGGFSILKLFLMVLGPVFGLIGKSITGLVTLLTWGGLAVSAFYAALAALAAFAAGLALSRPFREWVFNLVGDLNLFGKSLSEWTRLVMAEFGKFWLQVKTGFKLMWLDLKEAAGFDVSKEREKLAETLTDELTLRNAIIESIEHGAELTRLQGQLEKKVKEKTRAQQEAINRVTREYEEEIKETREAWSDAGAQVTSIRKEIENLVAQSDERLQRLGTSISTTIARGFAEVETSQVITGLQAGIREVERSYAESDVRRKEQAKAIENEIASVRLAILRKTVDDAIAAWDEYGERQKAILDAALTAQIITRRAYVSKVKDLEQKIVESKQAACERAKEILQNELNKSLASEKEYADKIKGIQDDIAGFHKTTEEKIRELRRKTMSDQKAYYDRVRELQEKLAKAEALGPEQYEQAKKLFKEVQGAAGGTIGAIERGDKVVVSEQQTVRTAIGLLERADSGLAKAGKNLQIQTKRTLADQKDVTAELLGSLDSISVKYDTLAAKLSQILTIKVEVDATGVDMALDKLEGVAEAPGVLEHYKKHKGELDVLSEKLGGLELAFAKAQEAAAVEVATTFDPEIAAIKTKIAELSGEQPSVEVKVNTDEVTEASAVVNKAVEIVDGAREKIEASPIDIVLEDNAEDVEANISGALAKVRDMTSSVIEVDLSTVGSMAELERLAEEVYKVQELTGKPLQFTGISTFNIDESINNIGRFKSVLDDIATRPHKVEVKTEGEEKTEELAESIDKVEDKEALVEAQVGGLAAVAGLADEIAKLHDKTVTITAKYVQEGGLIAAQSGGLVPGVGGTDSVPAKLTPGEFVLRKEAVEKAGLDVVRRWNMGMVDAGRAARAHTLLSKTRTLVGGSQSTVTSRRDFNISINMAGRRVSGLTGRARRLLDQLSEEMDILAARGASFG